MLSLWAMQTQMPRFPKLQEDIRTDVLVIGGGMAGILCAWFLKRAGVECVLAEGGALCGWNTGNTTAKVTSQHGLLYDELVRKEGMETAGLYLAANLSAVEQYAKLCQKLGSPFERRDSYVYSVNDQGRLEKEMGALEKLGYRAQFSDALRLPFSVVGGVRFADQGQIDPLDLASRLVKDLTVYERTGIREIAKEGAVTDDGRRIGADQYIVATHFPFWNRHGLYFMKMYQQRSYCIALEGAQDVEGMYVDEAANGFSFRNAGRYLLVGGGGHRTGKEGGCWQQLRQFAGRFYPKAKEVCSWAAQDCMTLDRIPYIGRYAKHLPGVWTATGFNKWGMTSSMVAAQILTDEILGKESPFARVFDPSRSMRKGPLLRNGMEAAGNLLAFSKKRCPHLGCALKWNGAEHSWDCPCHGSRFSAEGMLLDNPATDKL